MRSYKILSKEHYSLGKYSLVPIRDEDKYLIMQWRNEQINHLRQSQKLSKEAQEEYFQEVVNSLFLETKPNQLLFSFLKEGKFVGYGGLVYVNWIDLNAEISFLMDTSLEKDNFTSFWVNYLRLIERIAFKELSFHKIFTYAFDVRPQLYPALRKAGYSLEASLIDHCFIDDEFKDVKIHSKISSRLSLRDASIQDVNTTFEWVNNPEIRKFSFDKSQVGFSNHEDWFRSKMDSSACKYYILEKELEPLGSIRFDVIEGKRAKISYLIDAKYFGKGYGKSILGMGIERLKLDVPLIESIFGWVNEDNIASVKIFKSLEFNQVAEEEDNLKFELILK